jgi:maltose-binding protein MalE
LQATGTGTFIRIDEAVRAASLIPDETDGATAAKEFCDFWEAANNDQRPNPGWVARYGSERHDYTVVSKAEQFLRMIQTVILADAANQATYAPEMPEHYEYPSVVQAMSDAVQASKLIPAGMDVTEAASEFSSYFILGMREKRTAPKWCRTDQNTAA